jgi:hypothetical protein
MDEEEQGKKFAILAFFQFFFFAHSLSPLFFLPLHTEQLAKEEEEEAIRIQKKKLAGLQSADFDDEVTLQDAVKAQQVFIPFSLPFPKKKPSNSLLVCFVCFFRLQKSKGKKPLKESFDDDEDEEEIEQVKRDVSRLTKEEKLDIIASDSPELLELLEEFKKSIQHIREKLHPILERYFLLFFFRKSKFLMVLSSLFLAE